MEVVVELQGVHMDFVKVRAKQQSNKDDSGPSFSPTITLSQPKNQSQILTTTSMVDTSISIEKDEHREDVVMD